MRIPVWLTLGVAALVLGFGSYRIYLAFRKTDATQTDDEPAKRKGGLYAMSKRTHVLIGIVYLLLGAGLVATSFGWNPFGGAIGPDTETPTKDTAPTKGAIPIDKLPATK